MSGLDPVGLMVPAPVLEHIAQRTAELLRERAEGYPEPWLDVTGAAAHLACPKSRIYALVHQRAIPHHRDGSRLLFRHAELDAWVERGGARRR